MQEHNYLLSRSLYILDIRLNAIVLEIRDVFSVNLH